MICFVPGGSNDGFVGKIAIPNHNGEVIQISEATHHQTLPSCQQGQQKLWKTIQGEQSLGNPSVLDYIFEQLHCLPFCVFLPPNNYQTYWVVSASFSWEQGFQPCEFSTDSGKSVAGYWRGMNYLSKRCTRTWAGIYTFGLAITRLSYTYHHHIVMARQ